ncbi:hypothetical protein FIU00_07320 [Methylophilus medardicus]|uniref:Uncharacterized protein n=1 Tax=Methylophilus medardicus TaxID=2588534 RepID=A0A5B8CSQ7_9PROT|nr:hypothetical protein FIU01_07320 [Methylophilus medardicus]QDC49361.1 hypothetical protein FIU00_07320 [Methylophilus medardicus]QDC53066.1 hypothetical protein FIT99_07320 [Methylophilus medardicus]
MLILGIVISLLAYYLALRWSDHLLTSHNIELPAFTSWLVRNTFAFIVSTVVAMPFPSIL